MISNKLKLIQLAAVLFAPLPLIGQQIDPVAVSPGMYKVLLENDYVRVVEYTIKPGERDQLHTHPPKVSYVLSGGRLRITLGDSSFVTTEETGEVIFRGAVPEHYATNIGDTPVRIVLFEPKKFDATAAPMEADPFRNNPSTLKVLLENDSVRVLEATLPPGHKEKEHTHPPYAMYVLAGGSARFHFPDGSAIDVGLKTGDARFTPSVTHWGENTGTTEIRIVLVEMRHR
jgi:quercetin dioxygenase-like cupin family protein